MKERLGKTQKKKNRNKGGSSSSQATLHHHRLRLPIIAQATTQERKTREDI